MLKNRLPHYCRRRHSDALTNSRPSLFYLQIIIKLSFV